jgi:hypothetical protein
MAVQHNHCSENCLDGSAVTATRPVLVPKPTGTENIRSSQPGRGSRLLIIVTMRCSISCPFAHRFQRSYSRLATALPYTYHDSACCIRCLLGPQVREHAALSTPYTAREYA